MGERDTDGDYVDVLLPGFIEANSARQFGEPCLVGTRIPFSVALGWVWDSLDSPEDVPATREQIIALAAFNAGYNWHRSRKRRKKMDDEVTALWERINAEHQPTTPEKES